MIKSPIVETSIIGDYGDMEFTNGIPLFMMIGIDMAFFTIRRIKTTCQRR